MSTRIIERIPQKSSLNRLADLNPEFPAYCLGEKCQRRRVRKDLPMQME